MLRVRAEFLAGALAALGTLACGESKCPESNVPTVELTIENGAYQGACLYSVATQIGDDLTRRLPCKVKGDACVCAGVVPTGLRTLEIRDAGGRPLDSVQAEIQYDDCAPGTERVTWTGLPIDELPLLSCAEAQAHLDSCGFVDMDLDCVAVGLSARDLNGQFDFEEHDCKNECFSSRDCASLQEQVCAPDVFGTDYELCLLGCSFITGEEADELAAEIGDASHCDDSTVGAGGAG